MNRSLGITLVFILLGIIGFVFISWTIQTDKPKTTADSIPVYGYEIVNTFPHDRYAFTEGLAFTDGILIEGTGLFGKSTVREVALETGDVIILQNLSDEFFGEGVTVTEDKIYQLTEDAHIGFTYRLDTLEPEGHFSYPTRGWGLTTDGRFLIMSDGSAQLYFLDPQTFSQVRQIEVHAGDVPIQCLNELEYVGDEIYANVWPTAQIAIISPQTGEILGWINLEGLLSSAEREDPGLAQTEGRDKNSISSWTCPNGIAYDPEQDRLFVTGKLWPSLYEIRLTPSSDTVGDVG